MNILLFESDLRTLDTSNVELFFFPVLLQNHVIFLKRCMADVVEKGQNSKGVGKSLFDVYWKVHCAKTNSCILFENWIWGHANILTLEMQKDNF